MEEDRRNITQKTSDALIAYRNNTLSWSEQQEKIPALERLVGELASLLSELDIRTAHVQRD